MRRRNSDLCCCRSAVPSPQPLSRRERGFEAEQRSRNAVFGDHQANCVRTAYWPVWSPVTSLSPCV